MDTGSRKWGRPYLNRTFFSLLGERLGDRVLLMLAKRGGRPIAGALNLIGSHALYGRYWGAIEEHPFLHFELCYYQAIEWGIAHGMRRVEAGAQGEHKLARGYEPVTTYSAHWIAEPSFRRAVANYPRRRNARRWRTTSRSCPGSRRSGRASRRVEAAEAPASHVTPQAPNRHLRRTSAGSLGHGAADL